jgi:hypothetical protein
MNKVILDVFITTIIILFLAIWMVTDLLKGGLSF